MNHIPNQMKTMQSGNRLDVMDSQVEALGDGRSTMRECQDRLNAIKHAVIKRKVDIEFTKIDNDALHNALLGCDAQEAPNLYADQLRKQKQLVILMEQEKYLVKELESAQRDFASTALNQQSNDILCRNMEGIFSLNQYETSDQVRLSRFTREAVTIQNAELMRAKKLKLLNKVLRRNHMKEGSIEARANCITFQESLKRIKTHMLKTSNRVKERRRRAQDIKEMCQNRQYSNLSFLKNEIDEQKDILRTAAEIRLQKLEFRKQAELTMHEQMVESGENPYIQKRIAALRKKEQVRQESMAKQERELMEKITSEMEEEEKASLKKAIAQRKWERFWATRLKNKTRQNLLMKTQYLAGEKNRKRAKVCAEESDFTVNTDQAGYFDFELLKREIPLQEEDVTDCKSSRSQSQPHVGTVGLPLNSNVTDSSSERPQFSGFKWNPEKLIFKNFEIGETYTQKVTVTNTSLKRLKYSFRELLLELEKDSRNANTEANVTKNVELNEMVHVDFHNPSPLSPGLSHDFLVTFTPKETGNYYGKLHFDTPEGSFQIEIECLQKTFVPVLNYSEINFENVVVESSASITIKLKNVGSKGGIISEITESSQLPQMTVEEYLTGTTTEEKTRKESEKDQRESSRIGMESFASISSQQKLKTKMEFDVKEEARLWLENIFVKVTENTFICYINENQRQLKPAESVHIKVHFHPSTVGQFETVFAINSEEVDPVLLHVKAHSIGYPAFAEPLNTDFNVCLFGLHYQQKISFVNTSKLSGKIKPVVPSALKQYIEVVPKETQLLSSQTVALSVIFRPKKNMLEFDEMKSYFDSETNIFDFSVDFHLDFPVTVGAPISCTFQAVLADSSIQVSPTEIDLGQCTEAEIVRSLLTVTNHAVLPQKVGFMDLPQNITIQPNYGFVTLLPNESREFQLLVSIHSEMPVTQQFKVQTLGLEEHLIKISASLSPKLMRISHSKIYFPATCVGSVSSVLIEICNIARVPKRIRGAHTISNAHAQSIFEFAIPPGCPVQIKPSSGHLLPGESMKILVTFLANVTTEAVMKFHADIVKKKIEEESAKLQTELENINYLLSQPDHPGPVLEKHVDNGNSARTIQNDSFISEIDQNEQSENFQNDEEGEDEASSSNKKDSLTKEGNKRLSKQRHKKKQSIDETEIKKASRQLSTRRHSKKSKMNDINISSSTQIAKKHLRAKLLKQREQIQRTLDSLSTTTDTNSSSLGPAELEILKRELMHSLPNTSTNYTIPCIARNSAGAEEVHLLQVNCPMRSTDLIILEESNVIDFGQVEMYSKAVKTIGLYNAGSAPLTLKMDIVNPYGPFTRINALRPILGGHVFNLKLKFNPTKAEGPFQEIVMLATNDSQFMLILKGTSTRPEIYIRPELPIINIGPIVWKKLKTFQFEVENKSNSKLEFQFELISSEPYDGPDVPVFRDPLANQASFVSQASRSRFPLDRVNPSVVLPRKKRTPQFSLESTTGSKLGHGFPSSSKSKSAPSPSYFLPLAYNGPFEIEIEGITKELSFDELVQHLTTTKKAMYFGVTPKTLTVMPHSKGTFNVHCLLMEVGKFMFKFNIKLYNELLREPSIIATGV